MDSVFTRAMDLASAGFVIYEVVQEDGEEAPSDYRCVFLNERALHYLGLKRKEDFLGQRLFEHFPEARENYQWHRTVELALETRQIQTFEIKVSETHYNFTWVRGTVTPLNHRFIISQFEDITRDKAREHDYNVLHGELRAIVDDSLMAYILLDIDGNIVKQNKTNAEYWQEMGINMTVGTNVLAENGWPERQERIRGLLDQVFEQGERVIFMDDISKYAGRPCWINIQHTPVRVDDHIIYDCVTFIEMTETIQARETAEAASRAKSIFLANMSHELRNPLHSLLGASELLLENDLTPRQRGLLERIATSGAHLHEVVSAGLDYSYYTSDAFHLLESPFDLRTELDEIINDYDIRAAAISLAFNTNISVNQSFKPVGDRVRIRHIFNQLLNNAIKFTPSGAITLVVMLADDGEAGYILQSSIRDTGIGIAAGQQEHIFDDYYQVDSSTEKTAQGMGLGLSITRRLIELMGGAITVESSPGFGARFNFTIRLKAESVPKFPRPVIQKVLVVDDQEANCHYLFEVCHALGYEEIKIAYDGRQAIAASYAADYDVVFMDIQMPEVDGVTAAKAIRELDALRGRHTRIVAVTGYDPQVISEELRQGAFDDYLLKPVSQRDLAGILQILEYDGQK